MLEGDGDAPAQFRASYESKNAHSAKNLRAIRDIAALQEEALCISMVVGDDGDGGAAPHSPLTCPLSQATWGRDAGEDDGEGRLGEEEAATCGVAESGGPCRFEEDEAGGTKGDTATSERRAARDSGEESEEEEHDATARVASRLRRRSRPRRVYGTRGSLPRESWLDEPAGTDNDEEHVDATFAAAETGASFQFEEDEDDVAVGSASDNAAVANSMILALHNEVDEIGRALMCPICRSTLRRAQILPCVHAFCTACLADYFASKPAVDPRTGRRRPPRKAQNVWTSSASRTRASAPAAGESS